jgi:hypothetical protein
MRWLLLGACAVMACGGEASKSSGSRGGSKSEATPGVDVCRPGAVVGASPEEMSSEKSWRAPFALHALGKADASTLTFEADGTWLWTLYGCDVVDCAGGNWIVEGDDLLLTALAGRRLFWDREPAEAVHVRHRRDGDVSVRADSREADSGWAYGARCADCCGGGPGPEDTYACRSSHYDANTWAFCTEPP